MEIQVVIKVHPKEDSHHKIMKKTIRLLGNGFLLITPVYAQSQDAPSGIIVPLNSQYAFGNLATLGSGVSFIVPAAVSFFMVAVVLYLVIAGIKFIVSEGDKASVSEAKKTITHTLIALMLFILLFLVVKYLLPFFGIGFQIIK